MYAIILIFRSFFMSQEIEIEFKNLLTKTEFEAFKTSFNITDDDFITQENHYFDTPNFLLKSRQSALRIRKKQDVYFLTLKQPHKEGLLETHQKITEEEAKLLLSNKAEVFIDGEVKEAILKLDIDPQAITYLGTLKTNRAEIRDCENLLVLDHSFYLNHEDYELEYEVQNIETGKQKFLALLQQHNIPLRPAKNKILRFFETKAKKEEK